MWSDRSVVLAIGWAQVAPRIGATFALAPGWEVDTGYFSRDNLVRETLGVSSDREAADELLRRIERYKAGTLVKLAIGRTMARAQIEQIENGWQATAWAIIAGLIATQLPVIKVGTRSIPTSDVVRWIGQRNKSAAVFLDRELTAELDRRIAARKSTGSSSTATSSTDDRPAAFGSKN
jgi:hypothetical protein